MNKTVITPTIAKFVKQAIRQDLLNLNTSMPGKIKTYDKDTQKAFLSTIGALLTGLMINIMEVFTGIFGATSPLAGNLRKAAMASISNQYPTLETEMPEVYQPAPGSRRL